MWGQRLREWPLLVVLMGLCGLAMYLPALHALTQRQHDLARPFFYAGTGTLLLVGLLVLSTRGRGADDQSQANLFAYVAAFALLPLLLAWPLKEALPDTSLTNAWFEMVSSLTTTGATVYEPGRLAPSLHLWRALVGWMGGLFVLVAATAILAPLSLGGVEVLSGRSPGRRQEALRLVDPAQRVVLHLFQILPVYAGLTLLLWFLLVVLGENNLVALCHAMAVLSTSGISPVGGVVGSPTGYWGEGLMAVFLMLGLSRQILPGSGLALRQGRVWEDREVRLGVLLVLVVSASLMARHLLVVLEDENLSEARGFLHALWGSLFTGLSFLTTTGFVSEGWEATRIWAGLSAPGLVLAGLAMIGGGVATTAGGVKLLRVYALFLQGSRELERQVHPNSVSSLSRRGMVARDGIYLAWVFFVLFGISIAVTCGAMTFLGRDFQPALMFSISALANVGPLAAASGETVVAHAALADGEKIVLALAMIVGRVETIALLALLATRRWWH